MLLCVLWWCVCQEQEESLKEQRPSPVRENNVELLQEILRDLDPFTHRSGTAAELSRILTQPHFQVWDHTHTHNVWTEGRNILNQC